VVDSKEESWPEYAEEASGIRLDVYTLERGFLGCGLLRVMGGMREEGDNPAPAEDSEGQIGDTACDNEQKPER